MSILHTIYYFCIGYYTIYLYMLIFFNKFLYTYSWFIYITNIPYAHKNRLHLLQFHYKQVYDP